MVAPHCHLVEMRGQKEKVKEEEEEEAVEDENREGGGGDEGTGGGGGGTSCILNTVFTLPQRGVLNRIV